MSEVARVALGYLLVFTVLAAPLFSGLGSGISTHPNLDDAQLIVWILAWVRHALATDPAHLFDANINFPAAGQLTGSDHFLASQVLFAPLDALTGNPILSANLVALLTYPLAALAMHRLLRHLGCGAATAWLCGLVFALGPRRVSFNLHVLQYPNLFLPLVVLALVRLRDAPSLRGAAWLAAAFALGLLSSFYMAAMVGLTGLVWGGWELVRRRPERARFLALGLLAAAIAIGVLLFLTTPYFERAGGVRRRLQVQPWSIGASFSALLARVPGAYPDPWSVVLLPLVGLAVAAFRSAGETVRRILPPALALAAIALLMMPGFPEQLERVIGASPLRFFAYPVRFQVLLGFAETLVLACVLEGLRVWLGERVALGMTAVTALAVLAVQGVPFAASEMHRAPALAEHAAVYEQIGDLVRNEGAGPLLELPLQGPLGAAQGRKGLRPLEPDAMLGSTRHWLPLVNAYTGYHPPHRTLVMETIAGLPASWALIDLIDLTGLRWILLRPTVDWPSPRQRADTLVRLSRSPFVGQVWTIGDFALLRLDRESAHPEWLQALAGRPIEGRTVLGTPLEVLSPQDAVARITAPRAPSRVSSRDQAYATVATIENLGEALWPAVVAGEKQPVLSLRGSRGSSEAHATHLVSMVATWRPLVEGHADQPVVERVEVPLRRDVAPGDSIAQPVVLPVPRRGGWYELELRLHQGEGAGFDDPANQPLRQSVYVERRGRPSAKPPGEPRRREAQRPE